jgi:hypothetical protein
MRNAARAVQTACTDFKTLADVGAEHGAHYWPNPQQSHGNGGKAAVRNGFYGAALGEIAPSLIRRASQAVTRVDIMNMIVVFDASTNLDVDQARASTAFG